MPHINPDNLPSPASFKHRIDLQMRFSDVDVLGHVNNTVYFSYYDTGKAYYLETISGGKVSWQSVEFVLANVDCAFMVPIYFGEEIEILTKCEYVGEKSLHLLQMLYSKRDKVVKSINRSVMVSIDPEAKTSRPVPDRWRDGIARYEGTPGYQGAIPPSTEQDSEHIVHFNNPGVTIESDKR